MSYRQLKKGKISRKIICIAAAMFFACVAVLGVLIGGRSTEKAGAETSTDINWNLEEENVKLERIREKKLITINVDRGTITDTITIYLYAINGTIEPITSLGKLTNAENIYYTASKNAIVIGVYTENMYIGLSYSKTRNSNEPLSIYNMLNAMYSDANQEGYNEGYNTGKNDGYDEGYNTGKSEGYDEGKEDGLSEGYKGVFYGATYDIKYTYDGTTYYKKTGLTPNFGYSAIYFHDIWSELYENAAGATLENCTLYVHLKPFFYNTNIQRFIQAGYGFENLMFETENGKKYSTYFSNTNIQGYPLDIKVDNQIVNYIESPITGFEMYLGKASDTLDEFKLLSTGGEYNSGYSTGYNEGLSAGKNQGYQIGLKDGEQTGYQNGYNAGYNEGAEAAGNYTFLSLMTAVVDAPIKSFMGLLNFEILGFNMAGLIIGLLSVALLLKIINTFAKGG